MAVSQNDLQKMNDVLGRLGAGESAVSIINGDKTLSLENTGNGLQVGASLASALNVCKVAISNVGAAGAVLVFTAWTWQILLLAVGVLLIVGLAAYGLVWWERSQVEDLKATRQALQADINRMQPIVKDLERRGGALQWSTCGGRLCFEANRNQGEGAENWNGVWWRNQQTGRLFVVPNGF